jgi:hypothetical protein
MEGDTIKSKSMLLVEGDPPAGGGSGMTAPLRILHLEDDPLDAALIQSTLEAAGIKTAITRVVSREDFVGV